jgi:hypothetical protein
VLLLYDNLVIINGNLMLKKYTIKITIIIAISIIFCSVCALAATTDKSIPIAGEAQQFSYLAKSFLEKKLYFLEQPGTWDDTAVYKGKHYWPQGPLPAVLLMPFVYIANHCNIFFKQIFLQIWLLLGIFYLTFLLAKRNGFLKIDSYFLAFAFCLSSTFLGVGLISWSWQYAQVVTTFLLFLSLVEYTGQKRYWIIGLLMGLVLLTRMTAALGIIFFCFAILYKSSKKIKDILCLLVPFGIMGLILAVYNYARFDNVFVQGYMYQLLAVDVSFKAREYGLLGFVHLPTNLYYFLLSCPLPVFQEGTHILEYPFIRANPWGMSIFITSPYLMYLFLLKYHGWEARSILITTFFISLPIFLYYASGYWQFGYRYSLDFLPFLHFLLIRGMDKKIITDKFKLLIIGSSFFNLFLYNTLWQNGRAIG